MPRPRYKEVLDRMAAQLRAGQLAAGTRLPTHRALATREGISLVTASRVYAELAAMGLVSGETGRGTFVKDTALPSGHGIDLLGVAADQVDLNFNYPALPGQADLLRQALRQLAQAGDLEALLRYQPHGGRERERHLAAAHLRSRGLDAPPERVIWVQGAQHGLSTTVMALLQPGDVVAVDALSYPGFKLLAQTHRLELLPVRAQGAGPDLEMLETLCRQRRVRAFYTMPTLHNPLGWVTGLKRRRDLVALARRHGLCLIEDGAYAYLEPHAPPPLAQLAPELTVYVSGLSKSVAAGLRAGFVVAPAPWVAAIERAIRASTWSPPGLMTAIACQWLDDGTVRRLEAAKRRDAGARQQLARDVLGPLQQQGHAHSYFLWLPLPEATRADQVATALLQKKITVSTAEPFSTGPQVPHAIRLALGSVDLPALRHALAEVRLSIEALSY